MLEDDIRDLQTVAQSLNDIHKVMSDHILSLNKEFQRLNLGIEVRVSEEGIPKLILALTKEAERVTIQISHANQILEGFLELIQK